MFNPWAELVYETVDNGESGWKLNLHSYHEYLDLTRDDILSFRPYFLLNKIVWTDIAVVHNTAKYRHSLNLWWCFMGYKKGGNLAKKEDLDLHPHYPFSS